MVTITEEKQFFKEISDVENFRKWNLKYNERQTQNFRSMRGEHTH